jgi:hypothetical protein
MWSGGAGWRNGLCGIDYLLGSRNLRPGHGLGGRSGDCLGSDGLDPLGRSAGHSDGREWTNSDSVCRCRDVSLSNSRRGGNRQGHCWCKSSSDLWAHGQVEI